MNTSVAVAYISIAVAMYTLHKHNGLGTKMNELEQFLLSQASPAPQPQPGHPSSFNEDSDSEAPQTQGSFNHQQQAPSGFKSRRGAGGESRQPQMQQREQEDICNADDLADHFASSSMLGSTGR